MLIKPGPIVPLEAKKTNKNLKHHITTKNMIIVMKRHAKKENIERVINEIEKNKLQPVPMFGTERTVIAVIGDERVLSTSHVKALPEVSDVMSVLKPYKLVSRETKHENTIIKIKDVTIGGDTFAPIAGPCAVETEEQVEASASAVAETGVRILRGGAFKPRTGPYSFQGLGEAGLKILRKVADRHNMLTITEVVDPRDVLLVAKYSDILQIGTRNMQNFQLLTEVGKTDKPVMLKRAMTATIEEFLLAAEYIVTNGNPNVILCERGIRTFEKEVRNTLALTTVPLIKELSHLPIIVDPSHATGKPSLVPAMTKAAMACGADGFIIDVHANPEKALCDGAQAMLPDAFKNMMAQLEPLAKAIGTKMPKKAE